MLEKLDELEQTIIDALGVSATLDAVLRSMGYDEKKAIFEYIIRMYDLDQEEET